MRLPLLAALAFPLVLLTSLSEAASDVDRLERLFMKPPPSARPYVWWHWMGPNFSKKGITRDLEAMAASGIGGATIFNLTSAVQESQHPTRNNPWPENTYRSEAYYDAIRHACAEAARLGLEVGLHNTVGYSTTGGPWISEETGMQVVVHRMATITPGQEITLPKPELPVYGGWGNAGKRSTFYRDIAVLAVPAEPADVHPDAILDVTTHLKADDRLDWQPASGTWQVYRFGHAASGSMPHPVPDELFGKVYEADKLSAEANRLHWDSVIGPLEERLGKPLGKHLRHFLIDSYEAGHQSWTPGFREGFIKRFGYDPVPWLPSLGTPITGERTPKNRRPLGGEALVARFEHDYRTFVAELYQENGWKVAAERIHAAGTELQFEPYSGPFDTIAGAELADVPMHEFWTGGRGGVGPGIAGAARAAGRKVIGMEAFTGRPERSQWIETPALLRRSGDGSFASGANRMILHHWVHQPFDDRYQPGMGMGWWGTHFGRHQTWFRDGAEFFRYLWRVQALLQAGEQPVDVLSVGSATNGTNGDVVSWKTFREGLTVVDGRVVTPAGRSYRILHVPHGGALIPEDVKRIHELLDRGAHIVTSRPTRSPSLRNYPACDRDVDFLAGRLWEAGKAVPERFHGHGDLNRALAAEGIRPFITSKEKLPEHVRMNHRRLGGVDYIFVANLNDGAVALPLTFARVAASVELWDPETARRHTATNWSAENASTNVLVNLASDKSVFVVLRPDRPAKVPAATRPSHDPTLVFTEVPHETTSPWKLTFNSPVDSVKPVELAQLVDLSTHAEPAVRYFSGRITYVNAIRIPSMPGADTRVFLDLGEVQALARVRLNGHDLGVLWSPPFRADVTGLVKRGANRLEITVSTTWHNRLVGDEQEPADFEWGRDRGPAMGRALAAYPDWFIQGKPRPSTGRKAFVNWYYHRADTPLRPSGLIGPLRVLAEKP